MFKRLNVKTSVETSASPEFFEKRRRRRRIIFILTLIFVAGYAVLGGGVWLVAKSSILETKEIKIQGLSEVSREEVLALLASAAGESVFRRFLGANNLFSWPDSISSEELALLPAVKSIVLRKDYANKFMEVLVKERDPYGIWCFSDTRNTQIDLSSVDVMEGEGGKCFWFDAEGVIFRPAFYSKGNLIKVINDYGRDSLPTGQAVLPSEFLRGLFSVFETLASSGISAKEIQIWDLGLAEIEALTYDGPRVYFSLRFPARGAVETIKSLKEKGIYQNLLYVDFRVENRVYYK